MRNSDNRVKRKNGYAGKMKEQEAEGASVFRTKPAADCSGTLSKKKKKRPAWPAGAVQSATCGALCAANHKKDHNSDLIFFRQ